MCKAKKTMKIALIGGGEVGQCYAHALQQAGHALYLIIDSHPSESLKASCEVLGAALEQEPGATLGEADMVLCAAFGSAALAIAQAAAPWLKAHSLYVDLTTAKPADILLASDVMAQHQIRFIDVAIAGAIRVLKAKTPLLLAGEQAADFLPYAQQLGATAKVVGAEPGAAVSLKLLRSIFTKGCEALAVECLVAAEQKGLRQQLYEVLSDIDERPLSEFLEACVNSHVIHARRRLAEVGEAMEQMQSLGINPIASQGVQALFQNTVQGLEQSPYQAGSIEHSLRWLQGSLQIAPKP